MAITSITIGLFALRAPFSVLLRNARRLRVPTLRRNRAIKLIIFVIP
jgi:hypothetical protein